MTRAQQKLSQRQVDVLVLLAQDNSYKDIAQGLGITPSAVDYHLRNLRRAFRTRTLAGLVSAAIAYGILTANTLPVQATGQLLLALTGNDG